MQWFERFKKTMCREDQFNSTTHDQERQNQQATVAANDRLTDEIKAAANAEGSEDNKKDFWNKVTVALVFATFVTAGYGDYIFHQTMVEARRIARVQHQDTQSALSEDERAWVVPEAS